MRLMAQPIWPIGPPPPQSNDFIRLVSAVRDGEIRDTERVRTILAEARTVVEAKDEALRELKVLLYEAEQAFLTGWPATETASS